MSFKFSAGNFSLEGDVSIAFDRHRFLSLGFICIYLNDIRYGIREADATMMGCSYDDVCRRLAARGSHSASGMELRSAHYICAHRLSDYSDDALIDYPDDDTTDIDWANWRDCCWAPDGDEAFDDSSYVTQFDVGDQVRVVGCKQGVVGGTIEPGTLSEVWLNADDFYGVLARWKAAFEALWESMPKTPSRA